MTPDMYLKVTFVLALAGTLFSGYLSAVKYFSGTCALNESCPYFFGYPACWYGFSIFLLMLAPLTMSLIKNSIIAPNTLVLYMLIVSLVGILFAGRLVAIEVISWLHSHRAFMLILPSCVYGFAFFLVLFIISLLAL